MLEAEPEQRSVAHRDEDARAAEGVGCADQRLDVVVTFSDAVIEERQAGRVPGHHPVAFDDQRLAQEDGVADLGGTVVAVDGMADPVARFEIVVRGSPDNGAVGLRVERWSLQAGQGLADLEAEFGVQRQRADVVGGLDQPDSWLVTLPPPAP